MLCRDPFIKNGAAYGCGRCMPCRVQRRRLWGHRIMLETYLQKDNAFLTLTYNDTWVPRNAAGEQILEPRHLQLYMKRLRKELHPTRIRFYGVGEYGGKSLRPHYHVILFNAPTCKNGQTKEGLRGFPMPSQCCSVCQFYQREWYTKVDDVKHEMGVIHLGEVNQFTAEYTARYVEKKMTHTDDPRLNGKPPEFMRCSQGIGKEFMWDVASVLLQHNRETWTDVPSALRHGTKVMPLGRYLRGKLREMVGADPKCPEYTLDAIKAEMRPLREAAFEASTSFKKAIIEAGNQKVLNMEKRNEIFASRRKGDKL